MGEGLNGDREWLAAYFDLYRKSLFGQDTSGQIIQLRDEMRAVTEAGGKILIGGNGGSGAIASHCAVDLTKNAGLRSVCFGDPSMITCFANDYGYERWVEKAVEFYADKGDLVILISSSGKSPNIVNGARYAKGEGLKVVTFSGFEADNPLNMCGVATICSIPSSAAIRAIANDSSRSRAPSSRSGRMWEWMSIILRGLRYARLLYADYADFAD